MRFLYNLGFFFSFCISSEDLTVIKQAILENFETPNYIIDVDNTLLYILYFRDVILVEVWVKNVKSYDCEIWKSVDINVLFGNIKNTIDKQKCTNLTAIINQCKISDKELVDKAVELFENFGFYIIRDFYKIGEQTEHLTNNDAAINSARGSIFLEVKKYENKMLNLYTCELTKNTWLDNLAVDYLYNDKRTRCNNKELLRLFLNEGRLYKFLITKIFWIKKDLKSACIIKEDSCFLKDPITRRTCELDDNNIILKDAIYCEEYRFPRSTAPNFTSSFLYTVCQNATKRPNDCAYLFYYLSVELKLFPSIIDVLFEYKTDTYFLIAVIGCYLTGFLMAEDVQEYHAFIRGNKPCNLCEKISRFAWNLQLQKTELSVILCTAITCGFVELLNEGKLDNLEQFAKCISLKKQIAKLDNLSVGELQMPTGFFQISSMFPDMKILEDYDNVFMENIRTTIYKDFLHLEDTED